MEASFISRCFLTSEIISGTASALNVPMFMLKNNFLFLFITMYKIEILTPSQPLPSREGVHTPAPLSRGDFPFPLAEEGSALSPESFRDEAKR